MTRSNPFELFADSLEIERITFRNLKVRIRQRVEELGMDLKDAQLENMAAP